MTRERDRALARSRIYKLLSAALRYPTPDSYREVAGGSLLEEVRAGASSLGCLQGADGRGSVGGGDLTYPAVESEYLRTFEVGSPRPPCPPYEGLHRSDRARTAVLVEVGEFYRHFGLAMHPEEGRRELSDHLCAELEFLHFLCFKEAQAAHAGAQDLRRGYRLAQSDFLRLHPCCWLPAFARTVEEAGTLPPYAAAARLAAEFTREDLEALAAPAPGAAPGS